MKNLPQLYCLAICFVSTMVTLVASILLIIAIINITFFDFRNESSLSRYKSNESYINHFNESYYNNDRERLNSLSPEQITNLRIQMRNDYIISEKARTKNNIIDFTIYIIVSLLFTLIHYRIYQGCVNAARFTREMNDVEAN